MTDSIANNKRIAKNTLLLYVRMFIMMAVGLFTSRIILDALGVSDYGIYNVIGGLVTMFSVLTGAMSVATSRFLTFALGSGDNQLLRRTFVTAVNIHLIIAAAIVVIAEVGGIWMLNSHLNIPADRMDAANVVLQFSIATFVINLINVPYTSSIISHERMGIYAYFSLFDIFVKLGIVYVLYLTSSDRLVVYALLLCLANLATQIINWIYCKRKFAECRYSLSIDKQLLKKMFGFIGWAFWGNAAVVLKDQGMTILLNIFCGTIVNAAQGVANQVNATVNRFVSNFMTAVNPQITKLYASGDYDAMNRLIVRSTKLSAFLLLILIVPIIVNIDDLLALWLVEVPKHTGSFVTLILFYSFVNCFTGGLITGILANGKIKTYEIALTVTYILNLILAFVSLKLGMAPETLYVLLIIFKLVVLGIQLWLGRTMFRLPLRTYLKAMTRYVLPVLAVGLFLMFVPWKEITGVIHRIILSVLSVEGILLLTIYLVGFEFNEREFIIEKIQQVLSKIIKRQ
jgi:O-antigen/teichoic acid export membrane protein